MLGQRYAVLLGNGVFADDQQTLRTLRCPTNDVNALAEVLKKAEHGGYAVTTLIDATHDAARRAVYRCLQGAQHNDLVLIYYSGHGKLDQDGNLYLVTRDTSVAELPPTSFPVDDLKRYIDDSRASTTIVILDCCFSGAIKRLYKGDVADQAAAAIRDLGGRGTFYLTASTDVQLAEEKEGDEHSLLTKHIIAGIRDGFADQDDDGRISFQELCSYVQKQIPKEGAQRPRSWSIDSAGDVTIALTGKPAAEVRRKGVVKRLYELAAQDLLTDEVVSWMLKIINLPPSTELQHNFTVTQLIDSLHLKTSTALFLQGVLQYAKTLHAVEKEDITPSSEIVDRMKSGNRRNEEPEAGKAYERDRSSPREGEQNTIDGEARNTASRKGAGSTAQLRGNLRSRSTRIDNFEAEIEKKPSISPSISKRMSSETVPEVQPQIAQARQETRIDTFEHLLEKSSVDGQLVEGPSTREIKLTIIVAVCLVILLLIALFYLR
jgi:hypothetical protein